MIFALHGFTGSPAMWKPLGIDGPGLLGHVSEAPARGHERFEDEVSRLLEILPNTAFHLIGYSLGGRLALALALRAPSRIARLTLIGATPGLRSQDEIDNRRAWDAQWSQCLRTEGIRAFVERWEALPLWDSQHRLPPDTRAELRRQRLAHDPEQLARAMDALGTGAMPPLWHELDRLSMPVDLVAGQLDTKYANLCEEMAQRIPRATVHTIANAGHNPVLENPKAVLDVIHEEP